MLYVVCCVLYICVVTANYTSVEINATDTTEKLSTRKLDYNFNTNEQVFTEIPFTNPVKKMFQNIEGRMKKFGLNKNSADLLYNAGPSMYDYSEIWWTTTTKQPLITRNIFHRPKVGEVTQKPTDSTFKLRVGTDETMKPVTKTKTIPIIRVVNAKRTKGEGKEVYYKIRKKKINTTTTLASTTTLTTTTTTPEAEYMFLLNRNDDEGDFSIESNDTNIAIDHKSNDNKTGDIHVAVTSAFLIDKNITIGDYDYIIHYKKKRNVSATESGEYEYELYAQGTNLEGQNNEMTVIEVLKPEDTAKGLDLLKKGAKIIVGPESTGKLAKIIKKGLYNKYKETTEAPTTVTQQFGIPRMPFNQNRNPLRRPPMYQNSNFRRPPMYPNSNFGGGPMNRNPNFGRGPMNQNQNYGRAPMNYNPNYNRNQFNRNPNSMRYPINQNAVFNPNQNQNFNRHPFNQNGNGMGNYQNPNSFVRDQYNPYVNSNRNPNVNFNRNPNVNFNNNPNMNFNPNQMPYNMNNQNNKQNVFGGLMSPNFDQNQINQNNLNNPPNLRNSTDEGFHNSTLEINDEAKTPERVDPHEDFEAYLPTIKTTGLDETTASASVSSSRTTRVTFVPPDTLEPITRPGGKGPPKFTPHPDIPEPPVEKLSPYVSELVKIKGELKAGYFCAAMVGLFDTIATKETKHVWNILKYSEREFQKLESIEKIYEFGKPFHGALQSFTSTLVDHPTSLIKEEAKILHHVMFTRKEILTEDVNSIIDYIDSLFDDEDGIRLLKAVEKIHQYPNVTITEEQILRDFTYAMMQPLVKYHKKSKEKILFDSLNQLILNHQETPSLTRRQIRKVRKSTNEKRQSIRKARKSTNEKRQSMEYKKDHMTSINDKRTSRMIQASNTTKIGLHKSKKTTPDIIKTTLKTVKNTKAKQQRFKIKGNNVIKNATTPKAIPTTTVSIKTTTKESKEEEFKKVEENHKNKIHLRKKISVDKLLRLKIEHPKLYKKYFKKKKHHKTKKHKKHKRKGHAKHKQSKKDKLRFKYKMMEKEYQKLLKKYKGKNEKDRGVESSKEPTKRKLDHKINKNLRTENFPVTIKRANTKNQDDSHEGENIKQWFDDDVDAEYSNDMPLFPKYPENDYKMLITEKPNIAQKFQRFNKFNPKTKEQDYSDIEDVIKLNILDALTHGNQIPNARKSNNYEHRNKISKFSSYSSEEAVLKSKIYRGFVFNDFSESKSSEENKNNKILKDGVRRFLASKITTRTADVKTADVDSSYSDAEELLRKKLKI